MPQDPLASIPLNPGVGGANIGVDNVPADDGTTNTVSIETHKVLLGDNGVNDGFVTRLNPLPTNDDRLMEVLGRAADSLDQLLQLEYHRGGDQPRVQITDSNSAPASVKQQNRQAGFMDTSLVTQIHPKQQPVPITAMPANGTAYRYMGYVAGTTGFQYVGVPENEIFANVTTPVLVSSSTSDAPGGTGIRKVVVQYYDQLLRGPFLLTVALNGTTAVALASLLPSPLCYVETVYGIEFGSTFAAVGNVQLLNVSAGSVIVQINATDTMSYQTRHYIPKGITSYITDASVVASTTGIALGFVGATPFFDTNQNFGAETRVTGVFPAGTQMVFPTPIALQGPARFYMQALNGTAGGTLWGTVGFFDVPTGSIGQNPGLPITGLNNLPIPTASTIGGITPGFVPPT